MPMLWREIQQGRYELFGPLEEFLRDLAPQPHCGSWVVNGGHQTERLRRISLGLNEYLDS